MGGATQSIMADVSPARAKSEKQLGDVSAILQKLKDEVSFLQDEVERKGAGFYVPLAAQLMRTERAINDLSVTLDHTDDGLSSKDADKIPAAVREGSAMSSPRQQTTGRAQKLISAKRFVMFRRHPASVAQPIKLLLLPP